MAYKFYLGNIMLPVAPSKIDIRYGSSFKRVDMANGLEFAFAGSDRLAAVRFTALLPQREYPFCDCGEQFKSGDSYVGELLALKSSGTPFRFIILREGSAVNLNVMFEEILVREDASEGSDIYVDVKLTEVRRVT